MASSARALERCSTCTRAPVSRAPSSSRPIAVVSAASGRLSRKSAYARLGGAGDAARTAASSACTISNAPRRATSRSTACSPAGSSGGNSSTPDGDRKHLNPSTPASQSGSRSSRLSGTAPPQNPTSTASLSCASACFAFRSARVVVGGTEFSGMSTSVVTPPRAAAWVPVTNPSHSVRPGLVEVHVGVDDARHDVRRVGDPQHLALGRVLERRDRVDPAVDDGDRGRHERAVDQHLPALHGVDPHAQARGSAGAPSRTTVASISP